MKVIMNYTLPDGTKIDLTNIYEISEIKDYGFDEKTIDESTLTFAIRLKTGKSKKVSINYHYNDWFAIFKELKLVRDDLIQNWEKSKKDKSNKN